MTRRLVLALVAMATSACGGFQYAIPLMGPADDRAALAGHWEGEFQADAGRRSGIVDFDLAAAADTAFGLAALIPHDLRAAEGPRANRRAPSQSLEIEFIEIEGDRVRGALRIYRDPFDDERIRTTFQGIVQGDDLTGTYEAESLDSGRVIRGRWEMRRLDHS